MATVYLESSALLSWLLKEPRGGPTGKAIDAAETIVASVLTFVEVERALIRATRCGDLDEALALRLRGRSRKVLESCVRLEVSDPVLDRATRPFPVEPVRTLDALHLASALALTEAFPDLQVLSFDDRIRDNAIALGIG